MRQPALLPPETVKSWRGVNGKSWTGPETWGKGAILKDVSTVMMRLRKSDPRLAQEAPVWTIYTGKPVAARVFRGCFSFEGQTMALL